MTIGNSDTTAQPFYLTSGTGSGPWSRTIKCGNYGLEKSLAEDLSRKHNEEIQRILDEPIEDENDD